jgi:hypothetical protein
MSNGAPSDDFTVPSSATAVGDERRPRRTAILTVLFWNLLAAIPLIAALAGTMSANENPSGWEGLVFVIVLVLGGGGLVVSTSLGAAIAAIVIGRMTRRAAADPSATRLTRGRVILIGSLSTLGGWGLAALAVALFIGFTRVTA